MKFNVDDLVTQRLVRKKTYTEGEFKGLSVLKYHNKVFYNNLWYLDNRLLECRGMVVDEDDNIITWPFTKIFNLGENNTIVGGNTPVIAVPKINGFMAAMTKYKGGWLVSTTGSLDSEYVGIARRHLMTLDLKYLTEGNTYLFEICDRNDPHIVFEEEGPYLIGVRGVDGDLFSYNLSTLRQQLGCKEVEPFKWGLFGDIKEELLSSHKEGWMLLNYEGTVICKLKTPHYLSKKAVMRLGTSKLDLMFNNTKEFIKRVDEEFYPLVFNITKEFDIGTWKDYSEQQRRSYIEDYFYDN